VEGWLAMLTIKIEGLEELKRDLSDIGFKQIPFAAKNALNSTAKLVNQALQDEINRAVDRPNPATRQAMFVYEYATKANLRAEVGLRDGVRKSARNSLGQLAGTQGKGSTMPDRYLSALIDGGTRVSKRYERALQKVGVMPAGMYGVFAKRSNALDQYGNLSGAKIVQILSWFKAFPEQGYRMNRKNTTRLIKGKGMKWGFAYFRGGRNTGLPDGIWERHYPNGQAGKSFVRPIILFVGTPSYGKRIRYFETASETIDRVWNIEFDREFASAMRTAK